MTETGDKGRMEFTYSGYKNLLSKLKEHEYSFIGYDEAIHINNGKHVILRHDIDTDPRKALKLAELENENGVGSTYFVLITNDLYNAFSRENRDIFRKIIQLGHTIGLHYDEEAYPGEIGNEKAVCKNIIAESKMLADAVNQPVSIFSYHRPSKQILDAQIKINGMINSYGELFFHDFKYLSDSRRRWREPIDDIIDKEQYRNLHILTHAFWYGTENIDIHDTILNYIKMADKDRYEIMSENISDLFSIVALNNDHFE